mmetsp:Transcript_2197/g.6216  ORF Transcript_2197/g.6216 Transcript_2197/m.6216 type:complete len:208 (-) Transcript_2197:383-1006(-)
MSHGSAPATPQPWIEPASARKAAAVAVSGCRALVPVYCTHKLKDGQVANGGWGGLSFTGPQRLAKWLLEQPRGHGVWPWAVLVTPWEHAKQCAEAVRTACDVGAWSALRNGNLQPAEPRSPVGIAVACLLVLVEDSMEEHRAKKWTQRETLIGGACGPSVPVVVHSMLHDKPMFLFVPPPLSKLESGCVSKASVAVHSQPRAAKPAA